MQRSANSLGREERDEATRKSSDLRRRMSIVMYTVIFLYAAAFWIQTGVLPVSTNNRPHTFPPPPQSPAVPLQEAGGRPCNLWLYGDSVCSCYAPRRTSVWSLWRHLWSQSCSAAGLPVLPLHLPHPLLCHRTPGSVLLTHLCLHDARNAWYSPPTFPH